MHPLDDTIAAIASAPGGAARGIVRISGPHVLDCLDTVFQPNDEREILPPPHPKSVSGSLRLAGMNAAVPCDLYVWPEKRSYTGQTVAELHVMGCPPILEALLKSLCASGENGRTGRVHPSCLFERTDRPHPGRGRAGRDRRRRSTRTTGSRGPIGRRTGRPLHRLRETLLDLLAHLEAGFDFADEDLPFITTHDLQNSLACAVENVDQLNRRWSLRTISQAAVRAVLFGRPNTGKSSLFNALTRKEHAGFRPARHDPRLPYGRVGF